MVSLWSKIIWEKLGMREFKIHEHTMVDILPLVLEWIKTTPKEEVLETIKEIGAEIKKNVEYYDGNFHELKTGTDGLWIHDTNLLPFVLEFFLEFPELIDEIGFIKKFAEEYHKK